MHSQSQWPFLLQSLVIMMLRGEVNTSKHRMHNINPEDSSLRYQGSTACDQLLTWENPARKTLGVWAIPDETYPGFQH